jgi:hypothetical protein
MISGTTVLAAAATFAGGLEDRAHLHLVDLGVGDAQAAAAVAEHRVELVQLRDDAQSLASRRRRAASATSPDLPTDSSSCGRNSCSGGSSRRIVTGRPSIASKMPSKSAADAAAAWRARRPPALLGVGQDHLAHRVEPLLAEEHVLGAAQADALGAELARPGGVLGVSALVRTFTSAHSIEVSLICGGTSGDPPSRSPRRCRRRA